MAKCTNTSCGQDFDPATNGPQDCAHHPGGPVFHEGTKAWSCCKEVNKPVLDFDDFMKIPGCTKGPHTSEKQAAAQPLPSPNAQPPASALTSSSSSVTPSAKNGTTETYGTPSAPPAVAPSTTASKPTLVKPEKIDWAKNELVDDPSKPVGQGTRCKRKGCGKDWEGEDGARRDSKGKVEDEAECSYHPGPPSFLEGSKGFLCCKPRVLDFDDFLRLPGCRATSHQFFDPAPSGDVENVDCRLDHYQTPDKVIVSCFAKGVDKSQSTVTLSASAVDFDLHLPANKRCVKRVELYYDIDVKGSDFTILGTKIELNLKKASPASWPLLQKPADGTKLPPGYALTFGVKGRTGTVGGKEMVVE